MAQKNGIVNSLTQFIGQYNSDSELEDDDNSNNPAEIISTEWTKCFTKDSGLPYYYNTETRDVTWDAPDEYTKYLDYIAQTDHKNIDDPKNWSACSNETNEIYYVNKISRIVSWDQPANFKTEISSPEHQHNKSIKLRNKNDDKPNKKRKKGHRTLTKEEFDNILVPSTKENYKENSKSPINFDDATKTSTLFNNRIYSIKDDVDTIKANEILNNDASNLDNKSPRLDQVNQLKTINEILLHSENLSNDLIKSDDTNSILGTAVSATNQIEEEFDVKLIKRKKRIEFSTCPKIKESEKNSIKQTESNESSENTMASGGATGNITDEKKSTYSNFVKAGIMDNLNSPELTNDTVDENMEKIINEIKDSGGLMKDKLKFLCEGLTDATSAQIMFIQFETLMTAYESKNLNENYLLSWIRETTATLEKLEKEAIPDGWICEWDRLNSRYFYQNMVTGDKQWDFPIDKIEETNEIDEEIAKLTENKTLENKDEEMDISTTPPPTMECDIINNIKLDDSKLSGILAIPDPPRISDFDFNEGCPSPPKISVSEPASSVKNDSFGLELESFYSDIATIEQTDIAQTVALPTETKIILPNDKTELLKIDNTSKEIKKKLKKVKPIGISTKMKDISGMVAKWQKVQKELNK